MRYRSREILFIKKPNKPTDQKSNLCQIMDGWRLPDKIIHQVRRTDLHQQRPGSGWAVQCRGSTNPVINSDLLCHTLCLEMIVHWMIIHLHLFFAFCFSRDEEFGLLNVFTYSWTYPACLSWRDFSFWLLFCHPDMSPLSWASPCFSACAILPHPGLKPDFLSVDHFVLLIIPLLRATDTLP